MTKITRYISPIGELTLSADPAGKKLAGLWIEGQQRFGSTLEAETEPCPELPIFRQAGEWLDRYFAGDRPGAEELPLSPVGSDFCWMVWELLQRIPYGEVRTYGELAKEAARRLGRERMSAQAIGGAVGRNPISIVIPCHRVIGANGSLTGYAAGLPRKRFLLKLESSGGLCVKG